MVQNKNQVIIGEQEFSIEELVSVARFYYPLKLSKNTKNRIEHTRGVVERFSAENRRIYGITTGVGENSRIPIPARDSVKLQKNLIMSHACGLGEPLEEEFVRAIMVLMIQNFSQGCSGIRLETVETLVRLLNEKITPVVPREGSLGYLSHQAHISLVMIGLGEAFYKDQRMSGRKALKEAGIEPITLREKEGLSLLNGTVDMTALGTMALFDSFNILKAADIISMMSFEALKGTPFAFDPRISKVKPHPGQQKTIINLKKILFNSEIAERYKNHRTQDALSIRSIPQVHGACKDAVHYVKQVIEREMNSATDNPLVFDDEEGGTCISSANCHGEAVSLAMDFLSISIAELANIAERRIFRLVSPQYSELPPFLIQGGGVNSGYMIPQYVAAALVSDNKVYSHPASVDSIMTSGGQEDHVSMGTSAALKALKVVRNAEKIIGIELMCSSQALENFRPLHPGKGTKAAYDIFREFVPRLDSDRVLYPDMNVAENLIHTGKLVKRTEEIIGPLQI
ncbi:histidine ammonia-lyase [Melghirimyces profundicolus]|uniref:Histidine ammonia-lyase n=1 Tax=Melghirimyces profundicolus TaxID=1242148 RepID=A0A2T6BWA4_9BACL|nr:histidine ammonia-lyase [Melghirimyces profundicolus]PTX60343.1 histidine ammonia-lyase [Melghirimyces profundicolus]